MSNGNEGWTQDEDLGNWDEVSTDAPKPLEDGFYVGKIVEAKAQKTAKKGEPSVALTLSVTHVFQGDPLPFARKTFDTVTITKAAAFKVKQLAQAADVEPPARNNPEAVQAFADPLVGREVIVETKQETYQGKTNARVKRYLTATQAEHAKNGAPAEDAAAAAPPKRTRRGAAAA